VQGDGGLAYYEENAYGKTLKDYANAIKEVAEFYGIPVIDLYSECLINPFIQSHKTAYFSGSDGVHPNAKGHTIIARRVKGYLLQLASSVRE
jgi:lysophospholipase L1-like esterase